MVRTATDDTIELLAFLELSEANKRIIFKEKQPTTNLQSLIVNTYVLEFHNKQPMDFQYIHSNKYNKANGLQQNIPYLNRKHQCMDQHISDWHMILSLDNHCSSYTRVDIQCTDRQSIRANKYMNQRCLFLGRLHLFHMDLFDMLSLPAHDKLKYDLQCEWVTWDSQTIEEYTTDENSTSQMKPYEKSDD